MKKGFTLIELLVVVLIIGILSAIAVPQYTNAVEKARLSEALSMIGSLTRGIDSYVMSNGYPNSFASFLGSSNDVPLDVDVAASLECFPEVSACAGKYFAYDAYCNSSKCVINTARGTVDQYDADRQEYILRATKTTNGWTYECERNSKVGDFICGNLRAQGWN